MLNLHAAVLGDAQDNQQDDAVLAARFQLRGGDSSLKHILCHIFYLCIQITYVQPASHKLIKVGDAPIGERQPEHTKKSNASSRRGLAERPMQGRLNSVPQRSAQAGVREGCWKRKLNKTILTRAGEKTYGNGAITSVRKASNEVAQ
ncbi:predicted protein [Aspergillus nidulans FGSC A4]|uniref:Uncharacterized protein n=1 Tax=Emericella nidulans (strain FGSC A4 / ATCC 38163 / CBS 112.46 / NRRL 194 / M139) TaxID=227321 RepID=Q5AW63_EMENI|nr:hypothetical protein [Aspergillus nidulans FGSC A4]EAA62047.1 predicted protein [Aspergillus nidulans FGSC A4]CBF79438.1 TPA: hypothetical protein ANIA_07467 [Aspergillus nidulans FGSC A4]|eukprot:XP_680736.1 predicted protein [Aspergillus nidulans FGSC A4]